MATAKARRPATAKAVIKIERSWDGWFMVWVGRSRGYHRSLQHITLSPQETAQLRDLLMRELPPDR
jgi:hypothetical protein